jgi:predicted TIM-barrel fold metal-dependent hydrolase
MITRRNVLKAAGAAGIAASGIASGRAAAPVPKTPVDFAVPRGACDTHVHVVGDPAKYPMSPNRVYTPPTATADELVALQNFLHFDRVVIVTPSFYGTDNSCSLDAMRQLGHERARVVAVVDDKIPSSALGDMARQGVAGIRVNLATTGEIDPAAAAKKFQAGIDLAKAYGWHVQIYAGLGVIAAVGPALAASPVTLVLDHFGGANAALGTGQAGFETLLSLVRSGVAYVKISGAYRASKDAPDYADVVPLAKALVAANPDRIVWGTDWPHPDSSKVPGRTNTDIAPYYPIDDGLLLNQLPIWVPDAAILHKILVDNPARLYGFKEGA